MTKEEQFVNELIGYIFAYPNDDYMAMECLCRKLHKYGLIEKKDGEWTTDFIERKEEPKICDTCRYYNSNIPCGSTPSACKKADKFAKEFVDGLKKLKPKDEPQTYRPNGDYIPIDEWQSFNGYVVEMRGEKKPKEFRIIRRAKAKESE